MVYTKQREKMIERLREKGITDENVLVAMNIVPRHKFVASGSEFQAYHEKALPIGFEQTISHPYTVALMSQALGCGKGKRILEIGSGSGYQAAVLCQMGVQVFTIERISQLGKKADAILKELNYHFVLRIGDGTKGWESFSPFDGIIVTAGAPVSPESLLTATAIEISRSKNTGVYDITVTDQNNRTVALFRGNSHRIKGQVIPGLNAKQEEENK